MSQEFLKLQLNEESLPTTAELRSGNFSTKQLESVVCLENIVARWDKADSRDVLKSVTLTFEEAKLCVIVGPVGCGKVTTKL